MAYDSVVISVRLNPNDPLENKALEYLNQRAGQGHKARSVIAEALVAAADNNYRLTELGEQQTEIANIQRDMLTLLTQVMGDNVQLVIKGKSPDDPANDELTANFKAGLNKMARPIRGVDDLDE